jgi:hypothetical protein
MARDPVLEARLEAALEGVGPLVWKPMMGGLCAMLDGHMLCTVTRRDGEGLFMFRPGRAQAAEAVSQDLARPLAAGSRIMPGYVQVPADACTDAALRHWIALSRAEVARLPRKG